MFPPKSHDENCSAEFPLWLPETYNLVYELPRFVKRFMELQERYEQHFVYPLPHPLISWSEIVYVICLLPLTN